MFGQIWIFFKNQILRAHNMYIIFYLAQREFIGVKRGDKAQYLKAL